MGIDQSRQADLVVRGSEESLRILQREAAHLRRLARVGELTAGESLAKPSHAATAVVSSLEIFIPLEGLIDLEVERERLNKRIQEMQGRLSAVEKKLENENFIKRAPAEVVDHEREKHAAYLEKLNKLQENYQALT
jgi:valyl-tRNA synthetase